MDRLPLEHVRPDSRIRGRGEQAVKHLVCALMSIVCVSCTLTSRELTIGDASGVVVRVGTPMDPPRWATLERQLLAANVPACREFYDKYFDTRGHVQCFVRWGANDGPDDAFENFNHWPELHALGASDDVLQMFLKGHDGLIEQYTAAKTTDVPIARQGMYYKEFIVQSDWMHHGEGLQLFNRMGLSIPDDAKYQERARRFAGFYMARSRSARTTIRSTRSSAAWRTAAAGRCSESDGARLGRRPVRRQRIRCLHGESTFEQFLAHYAEYGDVVGDHFLNLPATTLPMNAYLLAGEPKYKTVAGRVHGRLARSDEAQRRHHPELRRSRRQDWRSRRQVVEQRVRLGIQPDQSGDRPREDRNRIPRALVGFSNALLVTGDQKYVDAWRTMIDAVNAMRARSTGAGSIRRCTAPTAGTAGATRLERRRAGSLVLVAEAAGPGARSGDAGWVGVSSGTERRRIPSRRSNAI
jgi:hypothetical protein